MTDEKIVMEDSEEAAKPHTMTGWLSRNGRFYAEERIARWDGCTHVACKTCGKPSLKHYTICDDCRSKADIARYEALPKAKWDGVCMVFSGAYDRYFIDPDDAAEFAHDEEIEMEDLRLVLCKPNYVRPLESEYCADQLPRDDDDGDVPRKVAEAMDAFNKAVEGVVLSWSPSKVALDLSESKPNPSDGKDASPS